MRYNDYEIVWLRVCPFSLELKRKPTIAQAANLSVFLKPKAPTRRLDWQNKV